jgi:hypothetical protein
MSAKECERYARAILGRVGGPSFDQLLMRIVETMVPKDGSGPPRNSDGYYFAILDLFPHVGAEDDVLGRLLCFAMRMCQLRIEKHSNFANIEHRFMLFAAGERKDTHSASQKKTGPNNLPQEAESSESSRCVVGLNF